MEVQPKPGRDDQERASEHSLRSTEETDGITVAVDPAARRRGVPPGTRRVRLEGELTADTSSALRQVLARLGDTPSITCLVVDLSGITAIDSHGLGLLVLAHAALRERGGGMVLAVCSPLVKRMLEATRLIHLLPVRL